jgi:hypothetical protein
VFYNSSTELVRITEDGNVGIGDASPIGDLQIGTNVFGGANGVHADDRIGLSVNGSLKSIVYASTYNNASYPDYGMVFIHGPNTGDYNVWSISPDGPAKGSGLNFIYRKDTTNIHTTDPKVYFNGDGSVGIGTTNPSSPLDIKASLGADLPLLTLQNSSNGNGATIRFDDQSTNLQPANITYKHSDGASQGGGASFHFTGQADLTLVVGDSTNKGRMVVSSAGSASEADYGFYDDVNMGMSRMSADELGFITAGTERVRVDSVGYVGIGTINPATILDLSQENNLVELSIRRKGSDPSANTDLGAIQFKTDYTSTSHDVGRILVKTNSSPYRTDMKFSTRSTAGTEMIGMTLHGTANSGPYLGVGTETPSSLLHVRGSDPVLKITDSSTTDNSATLWLQESDTYGVKLNYESAGGNGGIDYFTIDTLSAAGPNNQAGNHDNAWGIDQRGNVMPHKGAVDGNLLRPYEWLLYGPEVSGSTPSFPQNGTTAENARIYGENPFGEPAILWHTPSNDTGDDADGGWSTDTFQIDRGKSYRTSVWVKKITTTTNDGNLYLGTNYVNNLNGTYNSNPYFIGGVTMDTAGMETGQWYLMVGYIYDSGHSGTANHPDGGIYDRNGTKLHGANSFKFTDSGSPSDGLSSDFNKSRQRVYNFYDENTGSKTYWWGPRFEPLEESTPTLKELLNTSSSDTGAFFAGNVGIGTTAPSSSRTLHVQGDAEINTNLVANTAVYTKDWYGIGSNDQRILTSAGTTQVTIKNGGNVGIGTINPTASLDVVGNARIKGSSSDGVLTMENAAGSQSLRIDQNSLRTNTSNNLTLFTSGNSTQLVLHQGGNVGIGTNNPAVNLHVESSTSAQFKVGNGTQFVRLYADADEATILADGSVDMRFYTAGAEKMRLDTDGNVGIGTIDPPQKLSVKGTIVHQNDSNIQVAGITNANGDGRFYANNAGALTKVLLNSNGDSYFNGGNVGIGLTDPSQKLHVSENIRVGDGGASDYNRIDFTRYGGSIVGGMGWHTDAHFYIGGHPSVGPTAGNTVRVYGFGADVRLGDSVNGDVLTVDATNGNVGIRTTSPAGTTTIHSALDCSSDFNTHNKYALNLHNLANDTNESIGISFGLSSDATAVGAAIAHERKGPSSYGDLYFLTRPSGGNVTERMRITSAGNVGIGKNNPSYKLEIDGGDFLVSTANGGYVQVDESDNSLKLSDNIRLKLGTSNDIQIYSDNANLYYDHNNYDVYFRSLTNDKDIIFETRTSDSQVEIMRFDGSTSRVGIGTNSPSANLDIYNGSSWSELHLDGSNGGEIKLQKAGTTHLDIYASDVGSTASVIKAESHLQLASNNSTAANSSIYLKSNGNVGIGTDSPSGTLHVSNTGSEYTDKFIVDGSHGRLFNVSDETTGIIFSVNDAAGLPVLEVDSTSGYDKVSIGEFGTNALVVSGSGVSIGVTGSREEVLEVYPDKDESAILGKAHVGYVGFSNFAGFSHVDRNSTTTYALLQSEAGSTYLNKAASQQIYFRNNNNTIAGFNTEDDFYVDTDTLYVDASTSRVGIGTTLPSHTLTLSDATSPSLKIIDTTNNVTLLAYSQDSDAHVGTYSNHSLILDTNSSEAIRITSAGNVGIGVSSNPSSKLEVNGSFSASSKTFNIEHPTQSGKRLIHGCFEGPEHGVYFRGKTQDSGIQAPEYWSGLVDIDSMTVDVTPIGPNQSIYVDRIEDNGDVYVGANTEEPLNYFYVVYGERKDIDKLEVVKDAPVADTAIV